MSQIELTDTAPSTDWWYVRIYPGGRDRMDAAVGTVLPWVRERAREIGATRWHFLRFWDATGHHVRARVHGDSDEVDQLHDRRDELLDLVQDLPTEPECGSSLLPVQAPEGPTRLGVSPALYAPEIGKYGGEQGVELAEQIFTLDSEFHDDLDTAAMPARTVRAAVALETMSAIVERALPPESVGPFWAGHRTRWGWQLKSSISGDARLGSHLVSINRDIKSVQPDLLRGIRIEQHAVAINKVLRQYPEPLDHYLLHHVHMVLNRFGFPPGVEAALGILAARRHEQEVST